MNIVDTIEQVRLAEADLKRDNDIADAKAVFEAASARKAKWSARMHDEEYLRGPADSTNWRHCVAKAKFYKWAFRTQVAASNLLIIRGFNDEK